MNKENLSLHVQMFNNKVQAMNQTQSKDLVLTAQEARSLHSDIFNLLARIAELELKKTQHYAEYFAPAQHKFDGGSF